MAHVAKGLDLLAVVHVGANMAVTFKNIKLLQTSSITFTRHGSDTDKSYVDVDGSIVTPTSTSLIETKGSLQPFSRKQNRVALDEGMREEDFYVYYTKSDLRTTNQFSNDLPDTCTIDGNPYKIVRKGNWSRFGLSVDNNEYYLQLIQPQGS